MAAIEKEFFFLQNDNNFSISSSWKVVFNYLLDSDLTTITCNAGIFWTHEYTFSYKAAIIFFIIN